MDITDHLRELLDDISEYRGVIGYYSDLVNNKTTNLPNMYVINTGDYLTFRSNSDEIINFLWI